MATANAKVRGSRKTNRGESNRLDVVLVRKSGSSQDERGQIANIQQMLESLGIEIPEQWWFKCTVPRADVQGNTEFKRLLHMIEADDIGTIYVESQDRWGTNDVCELFTLIATLRSHGTHLISLNDKFDLTSTDDMDEFRAFMGGMKSKRERSDLAYRVMRTKVNNFKDSGSWPSGVQPFGFGKACYAADRKTLKWIWQPEIRTIGQLIYFDKGTKKPGPTGVRIPRKELKTDIIKLVPSDNRQHVKTVKAVFDMFVNAGLSCRAISTRLNAEGRKFYEKQFTHAIVREMLINPAYVGDTHYGKTQSGRIHTFDATASIVKVEHGQSKGARPVEEQLVRKNTHQGIIDRKTWKHAQDRFKDLKDRVSFSPRNPSYYLKPILVCGHCGKNMCGRTEKDPGSKKRKVVYFCSSYITGRVNGQNVKCGAHRITHEDAEQLLSDKLKELNIEYKQLTSAMARENLQDQVVEFDRAELGIVEKRWELIDEGANALEWYYKTEHNYTPTALKKLRSEVRRYYIYGGKNKSKSIRDLVHKAENEVTTMCNRTLDDLRQKLDKYIAAWVEKGIGEEQKKRIKAKCDELEAQIKEYERRAVPVSERLAQVYQSWDEVIERNELALKELPGLECREKGEAYRKLFKKVTLFWKREFIPKSTTPSRPLKTQRPGRNRFTLLKSKIGWELASSTLDGCL